MNQPVLRSISLALLLLATSMSNAEQTADDRYSIQFIVLGDWGMQGSAAQTKVAQQLEQIAAANPIEFIVTTGDNFYPFGVKSALDPLWRKSFEDVYASPHIKELPWYVTLGNHDYFGEYQAEIDYTKTHPRWILPATYHARDITHGGKIFARLLFADSDPYLREYQARPDLYHHVDKQNPAAQTAWLEQLLTDDQPVWKLVFAHHPLYTSGEHGNTTDLIQAWSGLFERYHVDAYFAGHDHHLEHLKPPAVTNYFISGGGGALTRPVGKSEYSLFSQQSYGFAHVTLDADCMRVSFIDQEGRELYRTAIAAKPELTCAVATRN